jgi:hypothetical protein
MNDPGVSNPTTQHAARPARRRCATLVMVLVIFVAGILVGAGMTVAVVVRNVQYAIKNPAIVPERAAKRLQRSLNLDERQAADVRKILFELQARLQQIRSRVYPDVQTAIQESRGEIAEVLTDEQRIRWEEIFADLEDRWFPPPPASASQ